MKQSEFNQLRLIGRAAVTYVRKNGEVTGAALGNQLRQEHEFQPFDYGIPTLTAFLRRWAPEVTISGRSGGDVVWSCRDQQDGSSTITGKDNDNVVAEDAESQELEILSPHDYRRLRNTRDDTEVAEALKAAMLDCERRGDPIGYGEWIIARAKLLNENSTLDDVFVGLLSSWASPSGMVKVAHDHAGLKEALPEYTEHNLAAALAAVLWRFEQEQWQSPTIAGDYAFRLTDALVRLFNISGGEGDHSPVRRHAPGCRLQRGGTGHG
jgi:hypothetical protein